MSPGQGQSFQSSTPLSFLGGLHRLPQQPYNMCGCRCAGCGHLVTRDMQTRTKGAQPCTLARWCHAVQGAPVDSRPWGGFRVGPPSSTPPGVNSLGASLSQPDPTQILLARCHQNGLEPQSSWQPEAPGKFLSRYGRDKEALGDERGGEMGTLPRSPALRNAHGPCPCPNLPDFHLPRGQGVLTTCTSLKPYQPSSHQA